jgi:hypothetical protein
MTWARRRRRRRQCTLLTRAEGRGRHAKPKLKLRLQTRDTVPGLLSLSAKSMVTSHSLAAVPPLSMH